MNRIVLLLLASCLTTWTRAAVAAPAAPLPRSAPEAQGVSSAGIEGFIAALEQKVDAVHSVMVIRHGKVIAEGWWTPYAADEPHVLFSLSKSFTSTAVGLAQAEGKLSVDDPVLKFFPESAPATPSDNLKLMRISDLLRMNTGHHVDDIDPFPFSSDEDLVKRFLSRPVTDKPGTHFFYDSSATYMLSAIVQKVTGQTVHDYLLPRLFEPLGFGDPAWEKSAQGISFGAFGLVLRTEDIARFGQLLLQRGEWEGRRLVPADWIGTATARQTSNGSDPTSDWDQGYGYQFWRCRHDFYRGDGAFGQFCIVMPQNDTVIAITSGTGDMGAVMNVIWDKLLPELRPVALPADQAAADKLAARLAALALHRPAGAASSAMAAKVSGRRFVFDANVSGLEALTLTSATDGTVKLQLRLDGADQELSCRPDAWTKGSFTVAPDARSGSVRYGNAPIRAFAIDPLQALTIATAGAWTADDTYTVKVCQYRSTFVQTIALKFAGDQVQVATVQNVSFSTNKPDVLTGRAP